MKTESLTAHDPGSPAVDLDRLYRVPAGVYEGLAAHGLIAPDRAALVDGLLVNADGSGADPVENLYRMPLDVYHAMIDLDLLTEHDPIELLDGLLVEKMSRKPPHVRATIRVFRRLSALVPGGWEVRKEDPISLPTAAGDRDSEPEPDICVVRGDLDDYADHAPGPGDVALAVEVARSSVREDREGLARYARRASPVAWIVNLPDEAVEVYTGPSGPSDLPKYQDVQIYQKDDLVPVVIDGREVGRVVARDLLP